MAWVRPRATRAEGESPEEETAYRGTKAPRFHLWETFATHLGNRAHVWHQVSRAA